DEGGSRTLESGNRQHEAAVSQDDGDRDRSRHEQDTDRADRRGRQRAPRPCWTDGLACDERAAQVPGTVRVPCLEADQLLLPDRLGDRPPDGDTAVGWVGRLAGKGEVALDDL